MIYAQNKKLRLSHTLIIFKSYLHLLYKMASSVLDGGAGNSNQWSITQHPLEAIKMGIQSSSAGESRGNRVTHMMSANEGPADIAAKISGCVADGIRTDDAPYFTNNEGIPFPDA